MKLTHYAAIALGFALVLSTVTITYDASAQRRQQQTIVTIDEVPKRVRPGWTIPLTGMVTDIEGNPMPNIPITVYLLTSDPKLVPAASGVTGLEGNYEVVWNVKLIEQQKAFTDVTQKVDTQVMSLFVQFDGDDRFASSKTSKTTVTIDVNSVQTFVNTDKKVYREGESALVAINFIDEDDEFLDPDSINANFNLNRVTGELEKKQVGSYTYTTPPLQRGHNQITVVPSKAGYNIEAEAVTITVLSEGSVGVFQLP